MVSQATRQRVFPVTAPGKCSLAEAFKGAMRNIAGTVTIITTEIDGQRSGMAVTSVVSLSMEPPSVIFCINRDSSIYHPLLGRGAAVINILSVDHSNLCGVFSGKEKGSARFGYGHWSQRPDGLPFLEDATGVLVARVEQQLVFGTHGVFAGEVLEVDGRGKGRPLVYLNGQLRKGA